LALIFRIYGKYKMRTATEVKDEEIKYALSCEYLVKDRMHDLDINKA